MSCLTALIGMPEFYDPVIRALTGCRPAGREARSSSARGKNIIDLIPTFRNTFSTPINNTNEPFLGYTRNFPAAVLTNANWVFRHLLGQETTKIPDFMLYFYPKCLYNVIQDFF